MAITFVNGDAGGPIDDNPTTDAINTTGASLIVAIVIHDLASITMSDSASNTWTEVTATDMSLVVARVVRVFYVLAPNTSAAHTFTATGSQVFGSIAAIAFAGTATASALDQQITGESDTTPWGPGSITPTQDNEVVVTLAAFAVDATSVSGGFTLPVALHHGESGSGFGCGIAYLIQTTAAAADPDWTLASSDIIAATNLSFKAAGAGGSAVLTGTAIGGITEGDVVAGGKTIIITLTGDTFIAN